MPIDFLGGGRDREVGFCLLSLNSLGCTLAGDDLRPRMGMESRGEAPFGMRDRPGLLSALLGGRTRRAGPVSVSNSVVLGAVMGAAGTTADFATCRARASAGSVRRV